MTERSVPRRARLELLVRGADDEGFEVREVSSAAAYVQLRPARVAPEGFELAEVASRLSAQRSFVLKNRLTEQFILLSEPERFLWEQMDGHTSLQEMATAYVLKYGQFDFDIIPALIRKLQQAGLLTMAPASRLRRALARRRRRRLAHAAEGALTALERVNISSRGVQPLFEGLYRWGGRLLFTRLAVLAVLALAAAGVAAGLRLWPHADVVAAGLGANPLLAIVSVKVLFLFTLVAHQIVHGLALVHYGRRVREFGFTFMHGMIPTFYVDVTDIFMASRRARVVTAVSGTLVHLVLASVWFLVAARAPGGFVQAFAAASGLLQLQAFAIALYPFCFIEMDGYHVLVDVLGAPTLKHDALAYTASLVRGRPARRRLRGAFSGEKALWIGYVVVSALSVMAFLAFNGWLIARAVS